MRSIRLAAATALIGSAILPAAALGQDQLTISPDVSLGPEGATATVGVTVQCPVGDLANLSVNLVQNNGGKLSSGSGFLSFDCTGSPQSLSPRVGFAIFALKQGKATASATLQAFDPGTFQGESTSVGPVAVRVHK